MAVVRRQRLLQLSRSADQRSRTVCVPSSCHRPLAACAAATQPEGQADLGTDDAAGGRLAPETAHPASLAKRSLRRHTPEVGAVCGKAARTDLCGGREVTRVLPRTALLAAPAQVWFWHASDMPMCMSNVWCRRQSRPNPARW